MSSRGQTWRSGIMGRKEHFSNVGKTHNSTDVVNTREWGRKDLTCRLSNFKKSHQQYVKICKTLQKSGASLNILEYIQDQFLWFDNLNNILSTWPTMSQLSSCGAFFLLQNVFNENHGWLNYSVHVVRANIHVPSAKICWYTLQIPTGWRIICTCHMM